jgi:hypothetical protein
MSAMEIPVPQMLVIMQLEDDIEKLTDSLTVGNYFWTMEIINYKKAQIEKLRRAHI